MKYLILLLCVAFSYSTEKVRVEVFYETLCPDSIRFFKNQLEPTYRELAHILDIETYAYGKASDIPSGNGYHLKCQHGPNECYGNMVIGCAQKLITDKYMFLEFAFCIMKSSYPPAASEKCAKQLKIDHIPINKCAQSFDGQHILHDIGVIQQERAADLYYVPWIKINNKFTRQNLYAAEADLKSVVCLTYTGESPSACRS